MKLKLFTFLLAVSFSIHAEESHYEKLSIKNEYDLLNVIIILTDHTILTNNLINTTQKTEFWNNKELRIKALECDVQELNRIKLRLYEKHKTFLTEQEYLKKLTLLKVI